MPPKRSTVHHNHRYPRTLLPYTQQYAECCLVSKLAMGSLVNISECKLAIIVIKKPEYLVVLYLRVPYYNYIIVRHPRNPVQITKVLNSAPGVLNPGNKIPRRVWDQDEIAILGRALGHFLFSLIGLKRILFTNYFSKALKAPPSSWELLSGFVFGGLGFR